MAQKNVLYLTSWLVSIIIFILIYESISYVKYQQYIYIQSSDINYSLERSNKIDITVETDIDMFNSDEDERFIKCEEEAIAKHNLFIDCSKQIEKIVDKDIYRKNLDEKNDKYLFLKDFKKSNPIIFIIYIFLIFTLVQQFYLFLLQQTKNKLYEKEFHIAEWNINTAPMFGLLGTFLSIALLLNAGSDNISTVLIENFFDAVMTTIIGIIFYIINFYLKTYIYPSIKFND